jgi:hypothetical protein
MHYVAGLPDGLPDHDLCTLFYRSGIRAPIHYVVGLPDGLPDSLFHTTSRQSRRLGGRRDPRKV